MAQIEITTMNTKWLLIKWIVAREHGKRNWWTFLRLINTFAMDRIRLMCLMMIETIANQVEALNFRSIPILGI